MFLHRSKLALSVGRLRVWPPLALGAVTCSIYIGFVSFLKIAKLNRSNLHVFYLLRTNKTSDRFFPFLNPQRFYLERLLRSLIKLSVDVHRSRVVRRFTRSSARLELGSFGNIFLLFLAKYIYLSDFNKIFNNTEPWLTPLVPSADVGVGCDDVACRLRSIARAGDSPS